ncbi:MAG: radical SAM family heme chaperone HemW [Planctomycetaceae bacterium]|nr:radical SAM family heme chaperone HemW [Planctomycetaceae bacterium]
MSDVIHPGAVYVHVPFCVHRCGYCDFALVASRDHLIPAYLTALERELAAWVPVRQRPVPVRSLFIGGGTPTHLGRDQLQTLMSLILNAFEPQEGCEITVEANPDTLSEDRMDVLVAGGVNRLSLGVQAFDNGSLKILERSHTAESACQTIQSCAALIPNISIDLIFGIPDQSLTSWRETLLTATSLPIRHISTYGLTYENGTPFFTRRQHGRLQPAEEETEREMYLETVRILGDAGYVHYEVSNFSRPGFACRHNLVYWQAREYHAFGPGAARYLHGTRSTNLKSVPRWIRAWNESSALGDAIQETETLSSEDKAREAIMLGLRLVDGFDLRDFSRRFGFTLESLAGDELQSHLQSGTLQQSDGRLRLTSQGRLIADSVIADFL